MHSPGLKDEITVATTSGFCFDQVGTHYNTVRTTFETSCKLKLFAAYLPTTIMSQIESLNGSK